ncbi:MAG: hypothetical protein V5804_10885 [Mucilaginibacter sp.]|uniref:hypothetical protein n=1 Tax=Mucilaginibacter sp. TaxID=1882438 RepID=UPI0034E48492
MKNWYAVFWLRLPAQIQLPDEMLPYQNQTFAAHGVLSFRLVENNWKVLCFFLCCEKAGEFRVIKRVKKSSFLSMSQNLKKLYAILN